jgi:hypothetical protein
MGKVEINQRKIIRVQAAAERQVYKFMVKLNKLTLDLRHCFSLEIRK